MAETVSRGGSQLAVVLPPRPSSKEEQPGSAMGRRLPKVQLGYEEGSLPCSQHRRQFVSPCREPCLFPPWMELGPSMRSLSDASTEKRRHSLPRSGSTSLSGCPLAWPTPQPLTPGLSPRLYSIYHPQKSFVTWTTRLSILRMPGAICVSSARFWRPSVLLVSRFPLRRPSFSETTSNTSDTKSVPRGSASLRTTRPSSGTGQFETTWRLYGAFLGKCG